MLNIIHLRALTVHSSFLLCIALNGECLCYIFQKLKYFCKIRCVSEKQCFVPLVIVPSVPGRPTFGRTWLLLEYHLFHPMALELDI